MAINFPSSPSVNDSHTSNGKTWIWNGEYWKLYGAQIKGVSLEISDTPPSPSVPGDLWFESDTGSTFTYYDSAWVELGNTATVTTFLTDADGDTIVHVEESSDEDTIRFDTAGVERMTIGASGDIVINNDLTVDTSTFHVDSTTNRVGIGTTSPTNALHVDSGSTDQYAGPQIYVAPSGHVSSDRAAIQLDDIQLLTDINGSGTEDFSIYSNNAGVHRFSIGGSGNVGINDTDPSHWLEVRDNDLGQTLGDSSDHLRLTSPVVGNTSMLSASNKRFASGTGWQNTSWRIQHRVDATDMAFVEFNPDGAERGISFGTDNVEHVVIDRNGRMAATNQPYFYATLSSSISFDSNTQTTTVPYNTTSANVGNCYNTSNGLFTAPVSGRYIFTGGIYSNTTSVNISQLWFVKNGGRVGSFSIDGGSGPNRQGTGYIYLDANDTLGVHPWADGIGTINIVSSIFHTYWSGSLLV